MNLTSSVTMRITAEESIYVFDGGYYKVEYIVKSSLSDRQFIEVKISNTGTNIIEGWALKYDACGVINDIWGGEIYKQEGTRCIIKNKGHNSDILPGKSITFGYTLTEMSTLSPDKFFICSKRIDKTYGYDAAWKITEETADGFSAEVTLSNLTQQPIEGWQLGFKGNFIVSEVQNAVLLSSEVSSHKVAGNTDTRIISADSSVSFNIIGSKTGEISLSEFSLSEIVIDEDFSVLDDIIELMLFASGSYNTETNTVIVEWYSNVSEGKFDIQSSSNGANFSSIAAVYGTDTYSYPLTQLPEMLYVKVIQTLGNKSAESNIIQLIFDGTGYIPFEPDADEDGVPDVYEEYYGTDPENPDSDDDGLTDAEEITQLGTDPLAADSDGNEVNDADEDFDDDGLTNQQELVLGLDPYSADTDGDGLSDGEEINIYGTDPLKFDTDGDGIGDSEELKIGLDPKNPATFGVPDSEYTIEQTVSSESESLSLINTENNPYKLSVEIKAAGYAEGGISAFQSSYSNVMKNPAILGICPELAYSDVYKVDSVTIKFEISDEYISNDGSLFAQQSSEFVGIKRFNIFRYFEDINMLLPVETKFDINNNILYTDSNALGSYCIMDMEKWLESLGISPEAPEASVQGELNSYLSSPAIDVVQCSDNEITVNKSFDRYYAGNSATQPSNLSSDEDIVVAFMIDIRTKLDSTEFSMIKANIMETSEMVLYKSKNAKIVLISLLPCDKDENGISNGYKVLQTPDGKTEFNELDEIEKALDNTNSDGRFPGNNNCNLSSGAIYIYNKYASEALNSNKPVYCFSIFKSENVFYQYKNDFAYSQLNSIKDNNIPIQINTVSNANQENLVGYAVDMYQYTGGTYIQTYDFSDMALKQIYGDDLPTTYRAILSSGLRNVILDKPITSDYLYMLDLSRKISSREAFNSIFSYKYADTDDDGLYDFEEINFDKYNMWAENPITFDENGNVILPTIDQCGSYACVNNEQFYAVQHGLDRFEENKFYSNVLSEIRILPILSDPTSEDGDGDSYNDIVDSQALIYNNTVIVDSIIDDTNIFDTSFNINPQITAKFCNAIVKNKNIDKGIYADDDTVTPLKNTLTYTRKNNADIPKIFTLSPKENSDYAFTISSTDKSVSQTIKVYKESFLVNTLVACLSEETSSPGVTHYALEGKNTYYIVVESSDTTNTTYTLTAEQDNWVYAPYGCIQKFNMSHADKYYIFITTEIVEQAVPLIDGYGAFEITDLRQLNLAITTLNINESSIDKLLDNAGIVATIVGAAIAISSGGAIIAAIGTTASIIGVVSLADFDGDYAQHAIDCQIDSLNLNLIYSYFDIDAPIRVKEKWQCWENINYVNKYKYDFDVLERFDSITKNPKIEEIAVQCGWISE